jgi:hypothetical protein
MRSTIFFWSAAGRLAGPTILEESGAALKPPGGLPIRPAL